MSTYCFVFYNYDGNVVCDAYSFYNLPINKVQYLSRSVFDDLPKDRKNNHKRRIVRFTSEQPSERGNKLNRIRSMEIPYKPEYHISEITNKELNFRTKRLIKYITCNKYKPSEDMYDYSSLSDSDENLSFNSKRVLEIIYDTKDPIYKFVEKGKFGSISGNEEDLWSKELNLISDDLFTFEFKSKSDYKSNDVEINNIHHADHIAIDFITMSCQINYPGDDVFKKGFRSIDSLSKEEMDNYNCLLRLNFIRPGDHYIWYDRIILKKHCCNSWGDFLSDRSRFIFHNGRGKWRNERISRNEVFSLI